jgi:hypothetical protein
VKAYPGGFSGIRRAHNDSYMRKNGAGSGGKKM